MLMKIFRDQNCIPKSNSILKENDNCKSLLPCFLLFLMNSRDALEREWLEHLIHMLIRFPLPFLLEN